MTDGERRNQVAAQCRVVAHLAEKISGVHRDLAWIYAHPDTKFPSDLVGRLTAERMEILGNILNGMDAVLDEDEWVNPIFERAHDLWPATSDRSNSDDPA